MKAYVVVDVDIHDTTLYEEYKKLTPASIQSYDGKFLVRGGKTETLEGDWAPGRFVLLEFPSMEKAREWYASADYTHARSIRQRAAHTQMLLVEGNTP
jgi:uncharacterized protein (DUF1330 family)